MLEGALGLRAPVPVGGNLDGAHAIAFKPKFHRRAPVRWGAGPIAGYIEAMLSPPGTGITALRGVVTASKGRAQGCLAA
jgi:hypothetical protein